MCMYNALKRCGAFVAALVLCFALSVSALADEVLTGSATAKVSYSESQSSTSFNWNSVTRSIASGASNFSLEQMVTQSGIFYGGFGWKQIALSSALVPTNSQNGIYLSGYYISPYAANQSKVPSTSDFPMRYKDTSTSAYRTVSPSLSLFAPPTGTASYSDGVSLVYRVSNSVSSPISDVIFFNGSPDSSAPAWYFSFYNTSSSLKQYYISFVVTSFRVVSTASNAELDALEDMASEIAAQSQILSQFYGDIVAVCNQIYQRLGDLQAAQEEANRLFSNVISLLNTTNGKLEAINMAMSTYFELLINQLKQEGIDTRTAIADAEARLELYLKPMIDYFNELEEQTGESASTLPKHKTDIDGFNNEGYGIEADGQTGLTAILPIFTAFSFILSVLGIFVGLGVLKIIIKKGLS